MGDPGFWDNAEAAKGIVAELKSIKAMIDPVRGDAAPDWTMRQGDV